MFSIQYFKPILKWYGAPTDCDVFLIKILKKIMCNLNLIFFPKNVYLTT